MSFDQSPNTWAVNSNQNLRLASFQHRLGALALDAVLFMVTFGIGWVIWSLIVWGEGQTPAKKILKIRVYAADTQRPATWGQDLRPAPSPRPTRARRPRATCPPARRLWSGRAQVSHCTRSQPQPSPSLGPRPATNARPQPARPPPRPARMPPRATASQSFFVSGASA